MEKIFTNYTSDNTTQPHIYGIYKSQQIDIESRMEVSICQKGGEEWAGTRQSRVSVVEKTILRSIGHHGELLIGPQLLNVHTVKRSNHVR